MNFVQAQKVVVDILHHHGMAVPVEFIFVEGYDLDGTNGNSIPRAHVPTPQPDCPADTPKRLFLAVQPPQLQSLHISRFDVRAAVDMTMGLDEAKATLALCAAVNALQAATLRTTPDWIFVAVSMGYELYIYFTYSMYCVCIACVICIICIPSA